VLHFGMVRRMMAWVGGVLFAIGFLNAVAFTIHAEVIGGAAVYEHEGRHYVNSHGKHTEVSAEQANRIQWHQRCSGFTSVTGILGLLMTMPAIFAQEKRWTPTTETAPR
jgi:hypothetical protein